MSRWRLSRFRIHGWALLWIIAVWVFLWGEVSVANVLAGALIGLIVPALLPLPGFGYHGTFRPVRALWLVIRFAWDLLVASFHVAILALDPGHKPQGAVVGVQLRSESDLYLAFTAEIATLVPGTVVVEAVRRSGLLYVHILDVDSMGGIEKVRKSILKVEERVLYAIASREELVRAGMRVRGNSG